MPETPERFNLRRSLLALIMLGVLLAGTAVAWLLVRERQAPLDRGAEILARIRQAGLGQFWTSSRARWFLLHRRSDGGTVGWRAVLRSRPSDGAGYRGLTVVYLARRGQGDWEGWKLNSDASTSVYHAGGVLRRAQWLVSTDTQIRYDGGDVTAVQQIGGRTFRSRADAPHAYLPEGLGGLVRRLVAEQQTRAKFRAVFNQVPPAGDRTRFGTILIEYLGSEKGEAGRRDTVAVEYASVMGTQRSTYRLDEEGNVVGRTGRELSETAASREDVLKLYPDAPSTLQAVQGHMSLGRRPDQPSDRDVASARR